MNHQMQKADRITHHLTPALSRFGRPDPAFM
jgi:hypothetical protein